MENQEIKEIIATQKAILEELENINYGDAETSSFGEKLASKVVGFIGSWRFIVFQSVILLAWIIANIILLYAWDPYPFILLNLALSFQAAFASPLILMAQNLTERKDRRRSIDAYRSINSIEQMMSNMMKHLKSFIDKNGSCDNQNDLIIQQQQQDQEED